MLPRWILALIFCPLTCASARADGLPLVVETVDEICVIRAVDCDHTRVCFFRDGNLLATRLQVEDMHIYAQGDEFWLVWQDYWNAERIVIATKLSLYVVERDPTQDDQEGVWWCARRRMADLRAAP